MSSLEPCPFCGGSLHLENWPWCDGAPCFELVHDDIDHAINMECPLVMGGYETEEDATRAVNTRYKRTCKWWFDCDYDESVGIWTTECGTEWVCGDYEKPEFCPNCGAEVAVSNSKGAVDGD